jgi:vancomycin aglycone glucosyltransferase
MSVLSSYGARGGVEDSMGGLVVGLAVRSRALQARGAEMRVCAPPDFVGLLTCVGVPLVAGSIMPA